MIKFLHDKNVLLRTEHATLRDKVTELETKLAGA